MKKLLIMLGALAILQMHAGNYGEKEKRLLSGHAAAELCDAPQPGGPGKEVDSSLINLQGGEQETDYTLYIPNTFTPNNDGLNDDFKIYGTGIYSSRIEIYNRTGEKLFDSRDVRSGWDGNYKGQPCEVATYVYFLEVYSYTGVVMRKAGHVNLIR